MLRVLGRSLFQMLWQVNASAVRCGEADSAAHTDELYGYADPAEVGSSGDAQTSVRWTGLTMYARADPLRAWTKSGTPKKSRGHYI